MKPKTADQIRGLVLLWLVGGLPPNIQVIQVEVYVNYENKLQLVPFEHKPADWDKILDDDPNIQEEDVELQEIELDGRRYLAGFAELTQGLIVGIS